MLSGSMVVLDSGDLATAMRASMAIPGAFAPVETEQHVLSDGGMVRNIPVDVARNLCADVVIVVNLVEQEVKREKLQTATQLVLRSSDVGIMANENLQLASLTDRDIRIDVIMGDITTADFERVPETIPLGETGGARRGDQLAPLAVPAAQYQAWRDGVTDRSEHRGPARRRSSTRAWSGSIQSTWKRAHRCTPARWSTRRRSARRPSACRRCRSSSRSPTR